MLFFGQTQRTGFLLPFLLLLAKTLLAFNWEEEPMGPIIPLQEEENVFNANDNISIVCMGPKPLQWTLANRSLDSEPYSQINFTLDRLSNGSFQSVLHIQNASYLDTNFYYCHEIGASSADPRRSAEIYLYIRDDYKLSVLNEDFPILESIQFSELIIPCRPTSPDVDVKLYKSSDLDQDPWIKVELGVESEDGSSFNYDPRYGFIMYKPRKCGSPDFFWCTFYRNHIWNNITVALDLIPRSESIGQPKIYDLRMGHTVVGELLTLNCTSKTRTHIPSEIDWIVPQKAGLLDPRIVVEPMDSIDNDYHYRLLKVQNVSKQDQGSYMCRVKDFNNNTNNASFYVTIFDVEDNFIRLTEENEVFSINELAGRYALWRIDIDAHPIKHLNLKWLNNNGSQISEWEYLDGSGSPNNYMNNMKYETNFTTTETVLKINHITIDDFGVFTLIADNDYAREQMKLTLFVNDTPSVRILSEEFHMHGSSDNEVTCLAKAYPQASISWQIKNCIDNSCEFTDLMLPRKDTVEGIQVFSTVMLDSDLSKTIKCTAGNYLGEETAMFKFLISDAANGFAITTSENLIKSHQDKNSEKYLVAIGDDISLTCSASIYKYDKEIIWLRDEQIINSTDDDLITIVTGLTKYSFKSTLNMKQIIKENSADYTCQVKLKDSANSDFKNITLSVEEIQAPTILESNMQEKDTLNMELPENLTLTCYVEGIPKPSIDWFKDNVVFTADNNRTYILENGQVLSFRRTTEMDEGVYSCSATNKAGSASEKIAVIFMNKSSIILFLIIIVALSILSLVSLVIVFYKYYQQRKLQKELQQIGLNNFVEGTIESINPELGLHEQAQLLPYYKEKWEFPKEKLKIGKQLGAGAFGMVLKAEAYGIKPGEESTIVAVKTIKPNSDDNCLKALASELKILVHLGQHLNVVNLLGACTKNVAKRELFVIVEYCRYGNLLNYLQTHRAHFVDQIDRKTGKLNFSIDADTYERKMSLSSNRSSSFRSANFKHFPKCSREDSGRNGSFSEYTGQSARTEMTTLSISPRGDTGGSGQADWAFNYGSDYKNASAQFITTKDLLAWGFQLARGMNYLASRKVLHGDLAARNILLTDNNVIKICDFGLAKSMYKDDNYKKTTNGLLPVRWMAIESIADKIFSTQSDIWSFGIVLWELFSLGKTPYPGMPANETFYVKILNGYRMESPKYATKEIYYIMRDCWNQNPNHRPSFERLEERIGDILSDKEKQLYIDLNDPYLVANTFKPQDQNDYLSMMSPPEFKYISSPKDYENDSLRIPLHPEGYLPMKPATIFSPTSKEATNIFTFDVPDAPSPTNETQIELEPMLSARSHPNNIPTKPNGFSNPSYGFLPSGKPISMDNCVNINVEDAKKVKNENIVINPSEEDKFAHNYVNSSSRDWEKIRM